MDRQLFELARNTALRSTMRYRLGAVLVAGGIHTGVNEFHELRDKPPFSIHAEMTAIIGWLPYSNGVEYPAPEALYVYRETKRGVIADSRPCRWCYQWLRAIRVPVVYYTARDGPHFRSLKIA